MFFTKEIKMTSAKENLEFFKFAFELFGFDRYCQEATY